jgi:hypothetical protein
MAGAPEMSQFGNNVAEKHHHSLGGTHSLGGEALAFTHSYWQNGA